MTRAVQADVIRVWPDQVPDAELWRSAGPELERPRWEDSRLVRNVSQPTLTVFLPEPSTAIGTGVVVCPGGGLHFLMVDKEGTAVARWLNDHGFAAFVLKYRVAPTPDDDDAFVRIASNLIQYRAQMDQVLPIAIEDGKEAVRTVRRRAHEWGIDPDRVGIVGFSAGGMVAAGVATDYDADSRPSFAAPLYCFWNGRPVPADAPPLFLVAASDDEQVDPQHCLSLYSAWQAVGRPAELHLYAQGGHGFALSQQGLPSDTWMDRFWDWLRSQGFVPKPSA